MVLEAEAAAQTAIKQTRLYAKLRQQKSEMVGRPAGASNY